ncbi:MAG: CBS domain-containing protein, partial [Nitrospinaceae bacterium]|nr:CBS domain-containing protein [Nitrospinaceae bacterium]NIR54132.1 CBS domain-containing protein [Nitrospinaceae bacterium]NIS84546.1 CBS domain-containing protein [Nitrospinaceae bacterium]NIT80511.1 CBS domain-containing protein [Nitrospinaceae bacterium]NIU43625.1 CBS domain-containing protein [Nitrospinaceae bacterium]
MDKIQDFMRTPVLFVDAGASAKAAAQQMIQHKVSSLLVKKGEEYVGIVTKTDLVKKVLTEGKDAQTTQVSSLM